MTKIKQTLLYLIRFCFVVFALLCFVWILVDPNYNKWGGVLAGLGLPFLPVLVGKIFKHEVPFRIQLLYYIFLFVALSLGICLDLYKNVPFFDKAVHFGSGIMSAIVGYYTLVYYKTTKTPRFYRGVVIVGVCMMIAVAWEIFEFSCDKFLGQNMQQLVTPGVDDTMFDLLAATFGSILGAILFTIPVFVKELEKN